MTTRIILFAAATIVAVVSMQAGPAQALTMSECSAKYKDAKAAGGLNGQTWNDFRKSQCGSDPSDKSAKAPAPAAAGTVVADAVFPTAVDSKYATEKPGRARRKTCLDQYKANKANNVNGGLKWIQKGGGYYSQCSKSSKGRRNLRDAGE